MRRPAKLVAAFLVAACTLIAWTYHLALADPIVRKATLAVRAPAMPPSGLRIAVLSDIHIAGPDMPPRRLARIVVQVNRHQPDLVLIAGDFVSDKRLATRRYDTWEAVRPLGRLRAPLGVVAVLGNHDYWRKDPAFSDLLHRSGVIVLRNAHIQRGGVSVVGIDDVYAGSPDVRAALDSIPRDRPPIVLSHSPDIIPMLPADVRVVVAGHTHCGQIALPLIGPLSYASRTGSRYGCGHIRDQGRDVIVSAGLGTSILPLRLGVPPDLWLLTVVPTKGRI